MRRTIPNEYLGFTLKELIALHAPSTPRGEAVALEVVHAAVDALAAQLEREHTARDLEQRAWLAQQFEQPLERTAPTDGGRDG